MSVPELPTGTVTFLFTDIEGSTRLVKQLRERYGEVRTEHERILREAVEANGGQEIDTQGDSLFVAFRRARDAVGAAVEAQRALAAHSWPEGVQVRVRMGIHTGEPVAAEGRYVGLGVHRAARISAAGHGGQVLLSNATRELVEDDLPPDVRLRDLGEHRLKDIDRPERVFQLEIEGLPSEFPPLKTLEGQPTEAPFAGREGELAEAAQAALSRPRVLRGGSRVIILAGAAAAVAVAVAAVLIVGGSETASALRVVDANAVGVIDPGANEIATEIEVGDAPGHMTAGLGALWVANTDANTVSRIDLETNSVRDTIRVGTGPSAVAVGAEAVWATNGLDRSVSRIDPETNEEVQRIDIGNGPAGVAVGEGAVWVANANDASISKIDPSSGDILARIDVGGGASAVAVGFGAVWVANGTSASVSRVDPRANAVVQPINVGNGPAALAAGFGSVWVANRADGTVSRIDAERNVVAAAIPVGESPSAIAVGGDAVWVADELAAKLVEIDPARNEVVRTLDVGNRPQGVAVVGDSVYVAVRATGTAHRGGTLRVRAEFIDTTDPALAYVFSSWSILSMTNDGLTAYRRVGGAAGTQLVPDLATALPTPTEGGRTYTFRLRRGIRYSTGAPVRAADFRRAIERSLTAVASEVHPLAAIVGAGRCVESRRRCDLSRGIVTDEAAGTVTFRLTEPDPDLPYKLTLPFAYPVPAGVPKGKPVPATGPYMIAARSKREIRLERNPNFRVWSKEAKPDGIPDTIVWRFGAAAAAQVAAVERGDADVAFDGVPLSLLEGIATRSASRLHVNPQNLTSFVFLNTHVPPFDDVRVRRALNYALDRNAVVEALGGPEQARPTCQVLPPNLQGYRPYCPYTKNPTPGGTWSAPDLPRAKRLVDASGTRGMEISLWGTKAFPGGEAPPPVASLLRSLGYRVRLKTIDDGFAYFLHTSDTRNRVQAGANGWITDYQSAFGFFIVLSCRGFQPRTSQGNNINLAGFCDRRVERDISRALELQTTDLAAASELWAKIDRAITDRAPWLFLANPKTTVFVSKRVGNLQFSPQWGPLLDQLWVR